MDLLIEFIVDNFWYILSILLVSRVSIVAACLMAILITVVSQNAFTIIFIAILLLIIIKNELY